MTHRTKRLVVANWKMHKTVVEARSWFKAFAPNVRSLRHVRVVVCPPLPTLAALGRASSSVGLGAQNIYPGIKGPFTGEVSAPMVASIARYVIVGHSERRILFGESDELVAAKVRSALDARLTPLVCLGDDLESKEAGSTRRVLGEQIDRLLGELSVDALAKVVVVYEPIWAISTSATNIRGEAQDPTEAQVIHRFIKHRLVERFGEGAATTSVIYGGSVKPANAAALAAEPDIDGALVGAASLPPDDFLEVCRAFNTKL